MMTDEKMLSTYASLVQLGHEMLATVEMRDWDTFDGQESRQAAIVDELRREDAEQSVDPAVLAQKQAMIEEILVLQEKIMDQVLPWRAAVSALIKSAFDAQRIAATYGGNYPKE